MEVAEKMVALKKAYADIILNTAKEAAARIMVSERKALRFQQDLCATKDEALRMLLRLKQMFDSKTIEDEIKSSSQQKRIEELEAQLGEAEETILDLRAELKKAQDQLCKVKNNHMYPLNESIEKQDGPCHEGTKYEKLANSSPVLSYHTDSGPVTSEVKTTLLNQKIMDCKCCNSAKQNASLKSDLENSCADNPKFASIIMRRKEPELYRNGCTQRVRAFERNLLDGNLPSSGNVDDQLSLKKSESITMVHEQNTEICTVPLPKTQNINVMKNPTRLEDKVCIKSCTDKDQPFKAWKRRRRKTRFWRAKATSCSFNGDLVKVPSLVLSQCKTSSYADNDNVKSGEGACTLPYAEAENNNLIENSSGLKEKVQQNKDHASVVRRSLRKRKVKYMDDIATSCRSLPDQMRKPYSESGKDRPNSEHETKITTDVDPISGSIDLAPDMKFRAPVFTGDATNKDTGLVDEAGLVKQGGDAAESPRVPSCKSIQMEDKGLIDSALKDAKTSEGTSGTSSQADNRLVKYTFSRKRKKESLTNPVENTSLGKNSAKKRAAEKQNGVTEPQKSSLIDESPWDNRRIVQVARQLISLSGRRW